MGPKTEGGASWGERGHQCKKATVEQTTLRGGKREREQAGRAGVKEEQAREEEASRQARPRRNSQPSDSHFYYLDLSVQIDNILLICMICVI